MSDEKRERRRTPEHWLNMFLMGTAFQRQDELKREHGWALDCATRIEGTEPDKAEGVAVNGCRLPESLVLKQNGFLFRASRALGTLSFLVAKYLVTWWSVSGIKRFPVYRVWVELVPSRFKQF